jgi:Trypsin-co-occurring domain 2
VGVVERIGLAETVAALRAELAAAVAAGEGEEIQFPMGPVELEFHVGVSKSAEGKGGLRFWVLELNTMMAAGHAAGVTEEVATLLGRQPRMFEQFAAEHRAAFGGQQQ